MSSRRNTQPIKDQSKDVEQQEKDAIPDKYATSKKTKINTQNVFVRHDQVQLPEGYIRPNKSQSQQHRDAKAKALATSSFKRRMNFDDKQKA